MVQLKKFPLFRQGFKGPRHDVVGNGPDLELNKWTHVAATYDQAEGAVRFFVDGEAHGEPVEKGSIELASPLESALLRACFPASECDVADLRIYKAALGADVIRDRIGAKAISITQNSHLCKYREYLIFYF